MRPKATTLWDLAESLGVSASTVSRALNGNPRISENTRKKVETAAKEAGFVKNSLGLALKTGRMRTIGMVVPLINRNYFVQAIAGVESVIYDAGYNLIITSTGNFYDRECKVVESLRQGRVVGVIAAVALETLDYSHYLSLVNEGIPVVMFDRLMPLPGMSSVVQSDYKGAYDAVKHLLDQGCRTIWHYRGPQNVSIWSARDKAYRDAMAEAGIEVRPEWVYTALTTTEEGERFAVELLDSGRKLPDAILFSGDFAAKSAMEVFNARGVRMPEDVAVVGFVNEPWDCYLTPPLTSVEQHPYEVGRRAAALMLKAIDGAPPEDIVLETELIVRESSLRKKE